MASEYSLSQFENQIGYLRRLNALSIEKTNSLFDSWFSFITKNPIECIDIVCETSNKRLIKSLLSKLVDELSNEKSENNCQDLKSILFVASCYINDLNLVKKYLENQDVNINFNKFNHLLPALHIACDQENLELTKLLLSSNKINVNLLSKAQPNNSALHKLCETSTSNSTKEEICKLLIKSNIDINISNQYNETPLHVCVYYENYNLAKLLIANQSNINKRTNKSLNSRTCLHYCANLDSDNLKLFKLLINNKSSNFSLNDDSNENVFQIANKKGNINICKYIVDLNLFPFSSNFDLILEIIYKSIELNYTQNLKYYILKFQFKLDVEKFLNLAAISKNFNEILTLFLEDKRILDLNNGMTGIKIIEYISTEQLKDLTNIMKDDSLKHSWYSNSKKLFQINNLYLENFFNLLKNIFTFDYKSLERIILNHLYLHKLVNLDLDYFDAKFDKLRNAKPIILYNDEKTLLKFLRFIILSGRLKQKEVGMFIRQVLENVLNKLEHNYFDLLEYLEYQSREIFTLQQLCRIKIRLHFISQNDRTVLKLNYPDPLKRYLNFHDIFY